ncbi:Sulfoacetaldehyde reductase [Actinomadura rubteroloni]|uniref:Sulfoacetaldehyde reductase n=1 Tax=Actinomadura rubteroloni TaxID=1926885 RepID=A0A2P4UM07_9ACTN|nr:SDR family NAD(P)-dependent oxidoreductase [Actinomadura rubteroloni]POM26075.1 Sulfoacetaldehyde reductase [Actinomadura rubteroloni]
MSLPRPHPAARAVVTGASSGIGAALAEGLAARGHALILVARRVDRMEELAGRLRRDRAVEVEVRGCDLADVRDRRALCGELADRTISVLCNNAGFATFGGFSALDAAREREEVEVNVVAVHELTAAVLPGMVARGSGAVLVTGSTAGHQPMPGAATYSASKAFVNTFAEALHAELRGTGVTCTLLAPGPVRTGFTAVADVPEFERRAPGFVWVSAEQAAGQALTAMERGRRRAVPGAFAVAGTVGGRYTPRAVLLPVLTKVIGALT